MTFSKVIDIDIFSSFYTNKKPNTTQR